MALNVPTPFLVLGDKSTVNLIKHPKVQDTLDVLHAGSSDDKRKWSERDKDSSSDVSKGGAQIVIGVTAKAIARIIRLK